MDLAKEIRLEAVRQGIQIQELADRAQLKRPYFSIRLNGHRDFTSGELAAVGEALGVPAWELLRRAQESQQTSRSAAS